MTIYQQQCLLAYLGYPKDEALLIDGIRGEQTANAVRQFQQDYGLTPDGIAGTMTEKMLLGVVSGTVARKVDTPTNTETSTVVQDACKFLQTDGYYHIPKGANVRLSEHFHSGEFDCHGVGCCTETVINPKEVTNLESIRCHFGTPITLTSAYRCPRHNGTVGGATGSRHCKGDAADIVVANHTPRTVAKYAEEIDIKGIGLYETSADGFFVHVDTRDAKSFWYGQSQQYRSTFK